MKTKIFTFTLTALFALVLVSGFASAVLTFSDVAFPSQVNHNQGNIAVTFKLTSDVAETNLVWTGTTNKGTWTVLPLNGQSINAGETKTLSAVLNIPAQSSGTITAEIKVVADSTTEETQAISIPITQTSSLAIEAKDITKTQAGTVKVTNTGNTALNNIALSSVGAFNLAFSKDILTLAPGTSETVTATSSGFDTLKFGDNTVTITAKDTTLSPSVQATASVVIKETFCSNGPVGGDLKLSNINIDNTGKGTDDEWDLLDEITVEVEVENTNKNDDVNDVFIELGLFDSSGNDMVDDLDFSNTDEESIDLGDLRDDDQDTVTFSFKVPADFDEGNYKLAVKAYSDDLGEEFECTDTASDLSDKTFEKISIIREDDSGKFIAFDDIQISPADVTCGDTVSIKMDAVNIGDEDQDQVRVNLDNTELGLHLAREIRNNLDQGDKEAVEFVFTVPQTEDKSYSLAITSDYDYRRGEYGESSDESETIMLNVAGCSLSPGTGTKIAAISATLESDAKEGSELVVKSTITNLQSTTADFIVDASGFESWASLSSISSRIVSLDAGESKDVTITLKVNDDVSGQNSFVIKAQSGSQVESRTVSVNVASGSAGGFSGFSLGGDNTLIWVIGIVNVILIILIIVVAVRLSRR